MRLLAVALAAVIAISPLRAFADSGALPPASDASVAAQPPVGPTSTNRGSDVTVVVDTGSAVMTVPVVVIDPSHPQQTYENATSEIKQYGVLWGGMVLLFAIGTFIVKQNDETHWLSKDHYLPIGVGVLGVFASILNVKFAGGSWTAVFGAIGTAVALIIQKPKPGNPPTVATTS